MQMRSELYWHPQFVKEFLPEVHYLITFLAVYNILVRLNFMHASFMKDTSLSKSVSEYEH